MIVTKHCIVGTHCYFACLLASSNSMISNPVNVRDWILILFFSFWHSPFTNETVCTNDAAKEQDKKKSNFKCHVFGKLGVRQLNEVTCALGENTQSSSH